MRKVNVVEDPSGSDGDAGMRRLASATLFGAAKEVLIEHEGEIYRLRRTSRGKLILTK